MRFLKIILSVFALFYRLTPNYLIISDVYFLHRQVKPSSRHRNKPKQTAKGQKTTAEIQSNTNNGKILHFLTLSFSFPDFLLLFCCAV